MDVCTDCLVTFESSVHCSHVLSLIQLLQHLTHVVQPRLPQSCLPGKLLCQLQQLFLPTTKK